jgi:adenylylsulfate kinase
MMPKPIPPGFAIWLTGLPSAGKTTIAHALQDRLAERGISVQVLDSDELRKRLTPNPHYSPEERDWFYSMIAFLTELLTANGVNCLIAATAPRRAYREAARGRIERFAEVYVDCPSAVCQGRDIKGLWEQARRGRIASLPGMNAPYEPPERPDVRVDTERLSKEAAAQLILAQLEGRGFFSP